MSAEASFVVVTDTAATVQGVLRSLRAQTISEVIELVLVCPSVTGLGLEGGDTEGLGGVVVVEAGEFVHTNEAHAAGIRAATAPIVMIGETHSYPEPDALERALSLFADPTVGAVAPQIVNANPGPWSAVALMFAYERVLGDERRPLHAVPVHTALLRREPLVELGSELGFRLTAAGAVGDILRAQGYRIAFEPTVVVTHLNVARPRSFFVDRYYNGRAYAWGRSRSWGYARRLLYAAGTVALPAVFAVRAVRAPAWSTHVAPFGRAVWPALVVGVVASAAGEAAGYARGAGRSYDVLDEIEVHRARHI